MSFHGLEMARQALAMQQLGLYTTGHNISNINTEGYSRQRVNFETMPAYPQPSRHQSAVTGQIGTGVQAGSIERIRDEFLDKQYRTQNSKANYWETHAEALYRMESIVNEMDDTDGLGAVLDDFWKSLEDLAIDPDNHGARRVVAQKALTLTDTFNHIGGSLEEIRSDLEFQLGNEKKGAIGKVNSLVEQIEKLNKQIAEVEPHGKLPNDLYDRRDALIDELSGLVSIRVEYDPSDENGAKDIAQGIARIELVDEEGKSFDNPVVLVGKDHPAQEFSVQTATDENGVKYIESVTYGDETVDILNTEGKISALIENYGYVEDGEVVGHFPDFMRQMDKLATEFAKSFNAIHNAGYDLDGSQPQEDFFIISDDGLNGAKTITVNKEYLDNPELIAASTSGDTSNGDNALRLAEVIMNPIETIDDGAFENENDLKTGESIKDFYDGIVVELAVKTENADRQNEFSAIQANQVQHSRDSVSAVSLDEEVTNLLKFQHAYNAAARSMTATDELLDKIINGMGIVGR